jgi:hypothetical protein
VRAATESTATKSTAPERISLLAVVGLGDEQLVDVHADPLRVERIHRVFGVDERAHPAELLRLGDHVIDERRLTRGLRAEDLDDPPARDAADPERDVERQRAGRDRVTVDARPRVAHPHDRPLAELPLDLRQRSLKRGLPLGVGLGIRRAAVGAFLVLAHSRFGSLTWRVEPTTVRLWADRNDKLGSDPETEQDAVVTKGQRIRANPERSPGRVAQQAGDRERRPPPRQASPPPRMPK